MLAACSQSYQDVPGELGTTSLVVTDGTDAVELDGMTVSGEITVQLEKSQGLSEIHFFIDPPNFTEDPLHIDSEAPFDVDLRTQYLSEGEHTLAAVAIVGNNNRLKMVANSTFTVQNGEASIPVEEGALPAPWASQDIGPVFQEGSAEYLPIADRFSLQASGQTNWRDQDSFHYVYQRLSGDGEITAQVMKVSNTKQWAKAGLMIRETLEKDARHAAITLTPSSGTLFFTRSTAGGSGESTYAPDNVGPMWLKLSRSGNDFHAFVSDDGADWSLVDSQRISMNSQVYVGMMLTSQNDNALADANFENVSLNGVASLPTAAPPVIENADLYVSKDGSDSNDGKSIDKPLRTIKKAISLAGAGDLVYIRGGIYKEFVKFSRSGTASNPITFASYPGETATIDGSNIKPTSDINSNPHMIWVTGSYVHLQGIEARMSPHSAWRLYSTKGVEITDCSVHSNHGPGFIVTGSSDFLIEGCEVYDNYDYLNPSQGNNADGISLSHTNRNGVVRHNLVYHNSDDGIDTWNSTQSLIEGNVIHSNGYGASGNGNGIKMGRGGNNTYRFNIAYNNKARGFDSAAGENHTIENNTAYNNGWHNFYEGYGKTNTWRNNLSYGSTTNFRNKGTQVSNSWNLGISNPAFVSTDPGARSFLTLSSGSPAIDAGINTGQSYVGLAPDLGALEQGKLISDFLPSGSLLSNVLAAN